MRVRSRVGAVVGDDRFDPDVRKGLAQLDPRIEDAVFAVPEQHDARGTDVGDLAAQFEADRASGAADEDRPPLKIVADVRAALHRRPSQQIGDVDLPQAADADVAVEQLEHARHHP